MREYKVVVLGSGGVGKSALTVRFVTGRFEEKYDPTIEDFYRKEITVNAMPSMLEILDTAGTEQFASMRDLYIKNGQAFVVVYSVTSRQSLNNIRNMQENIIRVKSCCSSSSRSYHALKSSPSSDRQKKQSWKSPPIILVANKSDLNDFREVDRTVGESLAREWECPFMEVSARSGNGVNETFIEIVKKLANMKQKSRRKCCTFI